MRILTIGGTALLDSFRKLGHRVRAIRKKGEKKHVDDVEFGLFSDMAGAAQFLRDQVAVFKPDFVFLEDSGVPLLHLEFESLPVTTVWYAIDTHLHARWHKQFAAIFDYVFYAQKNAVDIIKAYQPRAAWLPLFGPAQVPFVPWKDRKYEISFVGNVNPKVNPERSMFIDELLKRKVPLAICEGSYAETYAISKMVINQSIGDDLNFRFFEGPACGALLLTERISHSMDDILDSSKEYLWYERNDIEAIVKKISWVREHPAEAEAMARSAYAKINAAHTPEHRCKTILETVSAGAKTGRSQGDTRHLAWAYLENSHIGFPQQVSHFFVQRASTLSEKLCESSGSDRTWGFLVQAQLCVQQKEFIQAYEHIKQISGLPEDADLRLRYFVIKSLSLYASGDIPASFNLADQALQEFPGQPELIAITKQLKATMTKKE